MTLTGKHIIVTRAQEQSGALASHLQAHGATVSVCPLIAIVPPEDPGPLDHAIQHLNRYDWLMLASANAVNALWRCMAACGIAALPAALKIAVVGTATAAALAAHAAHPDVIPAMHTADALLEALPPMAGQRVLLLAANIARDTLAHGLRARGANVDVVTAYRTVPGAGIATAHALLQAGGIDAITFASPSAVQALLAGLSAAGVAALARSALVCIGPTTAATLHDAGLPVAAVAQPHSAEGMVAALLELYRRAT